MIKNVVATFGSNVFRSLLQFALNLILTRFIEASDYGLVAFTAPFLTLAAVISDFGLGQALTRERKLSDHQRAAALGATLILGGGALAAIVAAAGGIAAFGHSPKFALVMAAMSPVPFFSMAALVPRATLERNLRYTSIATIEGLCPVPAFAIGVGLAVLHAGVWALVTYNVLLLGSRCVLFALATRKNLSLNFDLKSIASLGHQGKWIMAQNLSVYFSRNLDNILIGARLGTAALGVYAFSYQFLLLPLQSLVWPVGGMLISYLRRLGDNEEGKAQLIRSAVLLTTWLTFGPMMALTFMPGFVVTHVMKRTWASLPTIMLWFGPTSAFQVTGAFLGTLLVSRGRLKTNFVLALANAGCLIVIFGITTGIGVMWTVAVYSTYTTMLSFSYAIASLRLVGTSSEGIASLFLAPFATTAAGLLIVHLGAQAWGSPDLDLTHWLVACGAYTASLLIGAALFSRSIRASLGSLISASGLAAT